MPRSAMVQGANTQLAAQSAPRIMEEYPDEVERLGERGTFVDVARVVLDLNDEDAAYLAAIPSALQEAMRSSIYDALAAGKSVQVLYSPAYAFGLQLWDYGEALSVHISGPYEVEGYESTARYAKRPTKTRAVARKKVVTRKTTASRSKKRGR